MGQVGQFFIFLLEKWTKKWRFSGPKRNKWDSFAFFCFIRRQLMTIISYVCENGDITKEIVVNEAPFDERLAVFTPYMLPLAKYIDTIHDVITPQTA